MTKNYSCFLGLLLFVFSCTSCSEDDSYVQIRPTQVSPVSLDLETVPYSKLSDYNFFEGDMSDLKPVYGVLPYKITSGLFIDYAKAQTFVWMPKGSKASYVNDHSVLDFPNGAVLITTHYFDNVLPEKTTKMIETRLLIKKEGEWVLVNYKWNDEQTEAIYTTKGSFVPVKIEDNNEVKAVNYKIPSYNECFTCHNKYDKILPIGPKPQNINEDFSFKDGIKNQLQKWAEFGYLDSSSLPNDIVSVVDWADESQPLDLRVRSYLDINCAHCHSDKGYCEYTPMRFSFNKTEDFKNMGVGVQHSFELGQELSHIISPGKSDDSALLFRISSTLDEYKMPIIGRNLQHKEGVQLIEQWINSLEDTKN
ncbi:hypothetical protein [Pontimicrobium aquaticum]|uniref:Repeat protein (TIGR03806 family) n=1 Tax=Pontimicrobium aquaticum TaxID=2565367 RepID=A0A4U0F1A7_9FLAO|nr:hypothetical protein [Pontimicrobium aquaticum]TJY38231.1 hypothetical protein E5167_02970 [Pontimicrobium aquaticum]